MPLRPIYYDTETTGTRPDRDRVVEIAAYDPFEHRTFSMLINPTIPIPKEASNVHNITDQMVENCPDFGSVGEQFIEFCHGDVVLIAHNNDAFDIHFLRNEFARHQLVMPSWKFIDSLKWARRYRPDLPRHPLQFLREVYNIAENNAHRALDDVMVLEQLFSQMIDDLTLEQVYALINAPRQITHMPFGKHQGTPLQDVPRSYLRWLSQSGALEKEENLPLKEALAQITPKQT